MQVKLQVRVEARKLNRITSPHPRLHASEAAPFGALDAVFNVNSAHDAIAGSANQGSCQSATKPAACQPCVASRGCCTLHLAWRWFIEAKGQQALTTDGMVRVLLIDEVKS
jgi:hypothetical protein